MWFLHSSVLPCMRLQVLPQCSGFMTDVFHLDVCFTLSHCLEFRNAFARVVPETDPNSAPIEDLGMQTGDSLTWVANIAAGAHSRPYTHASC